ncbi:MAG: CsgG/HfaB family protein [Spirochaetaceae bacterium]|jgi:TolB-like protein|nr:CsgG/HfaB family protein [Spirochaetaceae bacterium]
MKKGIWALFLVTALGAGLYPQARLAPPNDPNAAAAAGQSEIIIDATGSEKDIAVWVNDTIVAHVPPKSTEKLIVWDGRNILHLAETTARGSQWNTGERKQVVVDSASNRVTVGLLLRYGRLISVNVQQTVALRAGGAPPPAQPVRPAAQPAAQPVRPARPVVAGGDNTIEGAVNRAADSLIVVLPDGATLAILNISTPDPDMAEFVLEELAYLMVETRRFRVVDRRSLDAIRSEHNFQFSGDVDDSSAVSIGKMLGASIVITGSISGSGSTRRLRAKALDVMTAEIVAMASERF